MGLPDQLTKHSTANDPTDLSHDVILLVKN